MDIEKRMRMAAESILENEALRQGLDNDGAEALLDWGITCAKQIAADSAAFEDDEIAEEESYPRTKALRKMLSAVTGLYTDKIDALRRGELLDEIARHAQAVYGLQEAPETMRWNVFVSMQFGETGQKIRNLRNLIENQSNLRGA